MPTGAGTGLWAGCQGYCGPLSCQCFRPPPLSHSHKRIGKLERGWRHIAGSGGSTHRITASSADGVLALDARHGPGARVERQVQLAHFFLGSSAGLT